MAKALHAVSSYIIYPMVDLKLHDIIKLGEFMYQVSLDHLYNTKDYYDNHRIFEALRLNAETVCRNTYGYEPIGGSWPSARIKDFAALTRCARALIVYWAEAHDDRELLRGIRNARLAQAPKFDGGLRD